MTPVKAEINLKYSIALRKTCFGALVGLTFRSDSGILPSSTLGIYSPSLISSVVECDSGFPCADSFNDRIAGKGGDTSFGFDACSYLLTDPPVTKKYPAALAPAVRIFRTPRAPTSTLVEAGLKRRPRVQLRSRW